MNDRITLIGKIGFEPANKTKKHEKQASWKSVAMVFIDGEVAEYYAWFIKRRYNLVLNKPLRGAHISFINDRIGDMTLNGQRSVEDVNRLWSEVKAKWDGKEIEIVLDLSPRFDKTHWWLNVAHESRTELHGIRAELGLGKPYFGLHMSLGYANERNLIHHKYITNGIINGLIN